MFIKGWALLIVWVVNIFFSNTKEQIKVISCSFYCLGFLQKSFYSATSSTQLKSSTVPLHGSSYVHKKKGIHVLSPKISSPSMRVELLDAWDDDYDGVIINPESLPLSANAFALALRASLSNWKLKVGFFKSQSRQILECQLIHKHVLLSHTQIYRFAKKFPMKISMSFRKL